MTESGHAEECAVCGGLIDDREKYRDISIRGRSCDCEDGGDRDPSFTHWNRKVRSDGDELSRYS